MHRSDRLPGLSTLGILDPADELVAGQRRDVPSTLLAPWSWRSEPCASLLEFCTPAHRHLQVAHTINLREERQNHVWLADTNPYL
jgi:hypothetical protein